LNVKTEKIINILSSVESEEESQFKKFKDEIKFREAPLRSAMHCLAGSIVACPKVNPP
jgi:hypothetical protein